MKFLNRSYSFIVILLFPAYLYVLALFLPRYIPYLAQDGAKSYYESKYRGFCSFLLYTLLNVKHVDSDSVPFWYRLSSSCLRVCIILRWRRCSFYNLHAIVWYGLKFLWIFTLVYFYMLYIFNNKILIYNNVFQQNWKYNITKSILAIWNLKFI